MRTNYYNAKDLKDLIKSRKMATLDDLKQRLKTTASSTVFRKLRELSALTSYSHGGSYYTLPAIPRFNQRGLWSNGAVHFSRYGTLKNTLRELIIQSEAGYFEKDLEKLLRVVVRVPLLNLVRDKAIQREKVSGRFLCLSPDRVICRQQIATRRQEEVFGKPAEPTVLQHELKAAIVLFFSLLDERQKRFYAALETLKRGRGSDRAVADLLGINVATVARGRKDLLRGHVDRNRIRKAGGGRKPLEKKDRTCPKSSPT